jgi:hypothetical protein
MKQTYNGICLVEEFPIHYSNNNTNNNKTNTNNDNNNNNNNNNSDIDNNNNDNNNNNNDIDSRLGHKWMFKEFNVKCSIGIDLSIYYTIYLTTYLSIYPSIYPSIYLSIGPEGLKLDQISSNNVSITSLYLTNTDVVTSAHSFFNTSRLIVEWDRNVIVNVIVSCIDANASMSLGGIYVSMCQSL